MNIRRTIHHTTPLLTGSGFGDWWGSWGCEVDGVREVKFGGVVIVGRVVGRDILVLVGLVWC